MFVSQKTNQGLTEDFRSWEDEEEEYIELQAKVLQLRNSLVRQKRIRILNERTNAATSDRFNRAADLVAEMRSDLKSLKHRLEEELRELGKWAYRVSSSSLHCLPSNSQSHNVTIFSTFKYSAIDETAAEQILRKFYLGQNTSEDTGDASPLKRSRRSLDQMDAESNNAQRYQYNDGRGMDDASGDDLDTNGPSKRHRPMQ